MNRLLEWDQALLLKINTGIQSDFLDYLMVWISSPLLWVVGFVVLLIAGYRSSVTIKLFFLCAVGVGLADAVTYYGLKHWVGRFRPCKVLEVVRTIDGCGGWLSFPSNHATNAMCFAVILMLYKRSPLTIGLLLITFLVGFSRVYLGVHYPSDILFGFIWGGALGALIFWIGKTYFGVLPKSAQSSP